MPYLLDSIDSATVYKRPKQSGPKIVDHWGIVVHNKSGSYLVHDMPETGTVATPIENMSNNWKPAYDLPVKGDKNIHGMFKSTGLAAYLPQCFAKYMLQGTCILSTKGMAAYLVN